MKIKYFLRKNPAWGFPFPFKGVTALKVSKYGEIFLVRVFLYSDWIRRFTPQISVFSPNTGKYGPERSSVFGQFSHSAPFLKTKQLSPCKRNQTFLGVYCLSKLEMFEKRVYTEQKCSRYFYCLRQVARLFVVWLLIIHQWLFISIVKLSHICLTHWEWDLRFFVPSHAKKKREWGILCVRKLKKQKKWGILRVKKV